MEFHAAGGNAILIEHVTVTVPSVNKTYLFREPKTWPWLSTDAGDYDDVREAKDELNLPVKPEANIEQGEKKQFNLKYSTVQLGTILI